MTLFHKKPNRLEIISDSTSNSKNQLYNPNVIPHQFFSLKNYIHSNIILIFSN